MGACVFIDCSGLVLEVYGGGRCGYIFVKVTFLC